MQELTYTVVEGEGVLMGLSKSLPVFSAVRIC